ncbi:class E sortase [Streptomyces sp. NPDC002952]|uniref:class E sortase n=1 Tax=Streptomyces sp. NPDC002952 TaxID=3364673 RepID=UPI0036BCFE66
MRAPGVVDHGTRRRRALGRRVLWSAGEVLVTVGLVLALLVVHQVWWTNRQAREGAERRVEALEREWDRGRPGATPAPEEGPGADADRQGAGAGDRTAPAGPRGRADTEGRTARERPRRSQAYAVLTVPRLSLRVPVAEGVGKPDVLNRGYVGHYPGTAQPGGAGNFALAGHRNTHGEPFRHLDRLRRGDTVEVETRTATYVYAVDRTLPRTSARDGGVLAPVPRSTVRPAYGYGEPGYYLTLTTCTPAYTSKYRLVVWGTLRSMRPR